MSPDMVGHGDEKSEVYTIYNNSLEQVRDLDRSLCQGDDKSVDIKTEKEKGEHEHRTFSSNCDDSNCRDGEERDEGTVPDKSGH